MEEKENKMVDNVENFTKPNQAIMEEIKKEEQDREREEQKNAAKRQLQVDNFQQESEALELRYNRAKNDALAKKLKARTAENESYVKGDLDTNIHVENLEKIEKEYTDELYKAENVYSTARRKLREKNPDGYNRSRGW